MIIKVVLISLIVVSALWFLVNRTKAHARAGIKVLAMLFTLAAINVILFPQSANNIANAVGVGRGADLVLYLLTTFFLFFILTYYIRSTEDHKKIVVLARKIAILEANEIKKGE
jgi:hypothetical protein